MKRVITSLLVFVSVAALASDKINVAPLPPCEYVDTECVTNIPLPVWTSEMRHFKFTLEFDPAYSNNIEIAFGKDVIEEGTLSPAETEMSFAYDCGEWILTYGDGHTFTEAASTNTIVASVSFRMHVSKDGSPLSLVIVDNDAPILQNIDSKFIHDLIPPTWNLMRITTRGIRPLNERLRFKYSQDRLVIILR